MLEKQIWVFQLLPNACKPICPRCLSPRLHVSENRAVDEKVVRVEKRKKSHDWAQVLEVEKSQVK